LANDKPKVKRKGVGAIKSVGQVWSPGLAGAIFVIVMAMKCFKALGYRGGQAG
jgi:hypothetical protein